MSQAYFNPNHPNHPRNFEIFPPPDLATRLYILLGTHLVGGYTVDNFIISARNYMNPQHFPEAIQRDLIDLEPAITWSQGQGLSKEFYHMVIDRVARLRTQTVDYEPMVNVPVVALYDECIKNFQGQSTFVDMVFNHDAYLANGMSANLVNADQSLYISKIKDRLSRMQDSPAELTNYNTFVSLVLSIYPDWGK